MRRGSRGLSWNLDRGGRKESRGLSWNIDRGGRRESRGLSWNLDRGGRRGSRSVSGTLIEEGGEDLGVYLILQFVINLPSNLNTNVDKIGEIRKKIGEKNQPKIA